MLFVQVDPTAFYDDCWFDACVLNDADAGNAVLCAALESYVEQCAQANVTIGRWRTATLCRKSVVRCKCLVIQAVYGGDYSTIGARNIIYNVWST